MVIHLDSSQQPKLLLQGESHFTGKHITVIALMFFSDAKFVKNLAVGREDPR